MWLALRYEECMDQILVGKCIGHVLPAEPKTKREANLMMKVKRENQQHATNSMFIIKLLSHHISSIIMPIIRRIRPCPTVCGVLPVKRGKHKM